MQLDDGIFAKFRKEGIDPSFNPYFQITQQEEKYWTGTDYCAQGIIGSPAYALVDGKSTTAWASLDIWTPSDKSIEFYFFKNKIRVQGIALQTLCAPPNEIRFDGSNDNGKTWSNVCHKKAPFPWNNIVEVICFNNKPYSRFRLTQVGGNNRSLDESNQKQYRFHIYNFEIYGLFSKRCLTCLNFNIHIGSAMLYLFNIFIIIN